MRLFSNLLRPGLIFYTMLFFAFIYLPLALITVYSFNANPVDMMTWTDFTTEWYWQVLGFRTTVSETSMYIESTGQLIAALRNSLIIAGSTTLIATILGTALALALYRYDFYGARLYRVLMFMPMLVPDIVLGIALLIFFVNWHHHHRPVHLPHRLCLHRGVQPSGRHGPQPRTCVRRSRRQRMDHPAQGGAAAAHARRRRRRLACLHHLDG
jgi:ABC-type spermidine/putrescine transport system permease subunit II